MVLDREVSNAIDMSELHAENEYWDSEQALRDTKLDSYIERKERGKVAFKRSRTTRLGCDFGRIVDRLGSVIKIETIFGEIVYTNTLSLKELMTNNEIVLLNARYNWDNDRIAYSEAKYTNLFVSQLVKVLGKNSFELPIKGWASALIGNLSTTNGRAAALTKYSHERQDFIVSEAERLANKAVEAAGVNAKDVDTDALYNVTSQIVQKNYDKWKLQSDQEYKRTKKAIQDGETGNKRFIRPKLVTFSNSDIAVVANTLNGREVKVPVAHDIHNAISLKSRMIVMHGNEVYVQIALKVNTSEVNEILESNRLDTSDFPVCTALFADDKMYRFSCIDKLIESGIVNEIFSFDEYIAVSYSADTVILTKMKVGTDGLVSYSMKWEYNIGSKGGSLDAEHTKNISLASSCIMSIMRLSKAHK